MPVKPKYVDSSMLFSLTTETLHCHQLCELLLNSLRSRICCFNSSRLGLFYLQRCTLLSQHFFISTFNGGKLKIDRSCTGRLHLRWLILKLPYIERHIFWIFRQIRFKRLNNREIYARTLIILLLNIPIGLYCQYLL